MTRNPLRGYSDVKFETTATSKVNIEMFSEESAKLKKGGVRPSTSNLGVVFGEPPFSAFKNKSKG